MANKTQAPAAEADKSKASRRGGVLIGAIVLLVLLGGGGAAYWMLAGGQQDAEDAPAAEAPQVAASVLPLEAFVVNLADPGGGRFLRVVLSLVLHDAAHAKEIEENAVSKMRVRSAVLELLAQQSADRLITPDGKAELKKAIADAAGKAIQGLHVDDVLFSEFVVQF